MFRTIRDHYVYERLQRSMKRGIGELCPGLWEQPERAYDLDPETGQKLIRFILLFGECPRFVNPALCYSALLALPRSWLLDNIHPVLAAYLESDDVRKLRPLVVSMAYLDEGVARAIADRCADSTKWRVRKIAKLSARIPEFARKSIVLRGYMLDGVTR